MKIIVRTGKLEDALSQVHNNNIAISSRACIYYHNFINSFHQEDTKLLTELNKKINIFKQLIVK